MATTTLSSSNAENDYNNDLKQATPQAPSNSEERKEEGDEDEDDTAVPLRRQRRTPRNCLWNFVYFCVVFSAVPGATLACFSLAATRFGRVGAWQSGLLYLSYTFTALTLAICFVEKWGSKRSLQVGMWLMDVYVAFFFLETAATTSTSTTTDSAGETSFITSFLSYTGALVGGLGAGILWTAQGVYFSTAAQEYDHASSSFAFDQKQMCNRTIPTNTNAAASSARATDAAITISCSDDDNNYHNRSIASSSSWLAGIFATVLLVEETTLDVLSTVLVRHWKVSWKVVFGFYAVVALLATVAIRGIYDYDDKADKYSAESEESGCLTISSSTVAPTAHHDARQKPPQQQQQSLSASNVAAPAVDSSTDGCFKLTAALHLLINDTKTKYLCALPAVFGLAGGFLNSFVSSQVVPIALHEYNNNSISSSNSSSSATTQDADDDENDAWVGLLVAIHGGVAAAASLLFAAVVSAVPYYYDCYYNQQQQQGGESRVVAGRRVVLLLRLVILMVGCLAMGGVATAFLIQPNLQSWNSESSISSSSSSAWSHLVLLYSLQGIGRATFEGTLKAVVADCFPSHKTEGAFANILLQNGLWSFIAYVISFRWSCPKVSTYCVEYRDGTLHDIWGFAWLLVGTSIAATCGYVRVWYIMKDDDHFLDNNSDDNVRGMPTTSVSSSSSVSVGSTRRSNLRHLLNHRNNDSYPSLSYQTVQMAADDDEGIDLPVIT